MNAADKPWPDALETYLASRGREVGMIEDVRRSQLDALAVTLAAILRRDRRADLVFVCTHNSRRSHLGQIWARTAALHFGIDGVATWSGGTEATAFAPPAVAALRRAGFSIRAADQSQNPVQLVTIRDGDEPLRCWSKRFTDPANPQRGFCAILMCASAEAACPTVPGAACRVALTYDDPGKLDGTPHEADTYDARCAQIAREMLHLFDSVRTAIG